MLSISCAVVGWLCLLSAAAATSAPTRAPTVVPPSEAPTPFPTQILQTRMIIYANLRTTPQVSISNFKTNYRSSVEAAAVDIVKFPNYDAVIGQVLVTDVALINDGQSLVADSHDPTYTVTGARCSLPSDLQDSVTVKISFIFENTGFPDKATAFWELSQQLADATDDGRMKKLTNGYIKSLNPSKSLSLLNVSCFSSTAHDVEEVILRSPAPSAAPTSEPFSDGPKKYALAICLSVILFAALCVMAVGSVVDNRDRIVAEVLKTNAERADGDLLNFSDTYSGRDADALAPVIGRAGAAGQRRRALCEAVEIVKSALPYLEYAQYFDVLRAYVQWQRDSGEEGSPEDSQEIDQAGVSWLYYTRYFLGAHDGCYAENIWLQHRWLSVIFYAPVKSRTMRCFSALYFTVMMLCFVTLLIVHTDTFAPARTVESLFVRDVVVACSITALISASCYGFVETAVFYCFDESKEFVKPLVVDTTKPKTGTQRRIGASSPSNWQSVPVGSAGQDDPLDAHSPLNRPSAPESAPLGQEPRDRSVSAQLGRSSKSSPRSTQQTRSPSPPRGNSGWAPSGKNKVAPMGPAEAEKKNAELLALMERALVDEEYLYSESICDELLRLQDDIMFCREAIHSACEQCRIPNPDSHANAPNKAVNDFEVAIEDALLAVQFDATWGLDSQGAFMVDGDVVPDWRDPPHSVDDNSVVHWWKSNIGNLFSAYKGEVVKPKEGRGVSSPLVELGSDIVRVRRQVLKEQLKRYSEVLSVAPASLNESSGGQNTSAEFDFASSDPYGVSTLHRVNFLSTGSDNRKLRRRLVQLFHDDTLPPLSAAIVRNQIHRNRWMTEKFYSDQSLRVLGAVLTIVSFLLMVCWIYVYAFRILNIRQTSILIVFLVWLMLDIFVIETLSLLVRHVVIPSFAHRDVADVISWLMFGIVAKDKENATRANADTADSNGQSVAIRRSDSNLSIRPSLHGEVIPSTDADQGNENVRSMRMFNAAKHLFVSVRLANLSALKKPFLESIVVSEFQTLWPKRSYLSDFGARNNFGFVNEKGACLFNEQGRDGVAGNVVRSSARAGSVVPVGATGETPIIIISAPAVAQWVPQTAHDEHYHDRGWVEQLFDFDTISQCIKLFVSKAFFYFINRLPILVQNALLEYCLWALVLWFLYLCIYIINTTTLVIIIPVVAVAILIRVILLLFSNKNRMGQPEDGFELEPELLDSRSEEEDYFDEEGEHRFRGDSGVSGGDLLGPQDEYYSEGYSESDIYESGIGGSEYADTQRAYHDNRGSFRDDGGGDPGSDFGNDSSYNNANPASRAQINSKASKTTGGIIDNGMARPAERSHHAKTTTLSPLPNIGSRFVPREDVEYSEDEDSPPRNAANSAIDSDVSIRANTRPTLDNQYQNDVTQDRKRSTHHRDQQPRSAEDSPRERQGPFTVARGAEGGEQAHGHHHRLKLPRSAGESPREYRESGAVAGGGGAQPLRSRTAHSNQQHNQFPPEDIDDGYGQGPLDRKIAPESYHYDENDTPFTEVPAYSDTAYKGGMRDPFASSNAKTPAMRMGGGQRGYDSEYQTSKYNPIISPPNATPQVERHYPSKGDQKVAAVAAPNAEMTNSVVKKVEADMKQWAQYEMDNDKSLSFQMYQDDVDIDISHEGSSGEESGSGDEGSREGASDAPSPIASSNNDAAEQDRINFTMSRFGKSN